MIPCVAEALKAMEKVASHINEMQKLHEDYGAVFDQLVAEQSGPEKEVSGLPHFEASGLCLRVTFRLGHMVRAFPAGEIACKSHWGLNAHNKPAIWFRCKCNKFIPLV